MTASGDLVVGKHFDLSGAHIRGAEAELQPAACLLEYVEIDRLLENLAQRIDVEGIELIGRHQPRHHIERKIWHRIFERSVAHQTIENRGLHGAERRGMADSPPEVGERLARSLAPAFDQPVTEHGGIHATGAGRDHAFEIEPLIFEQAIEHTPGERTMGATTLKCQVEGLGPAFGCYAELARRNGAFHVDRLLNIHDVRPVFSARSIRHRPEGPFP
jgi:hypothetical protein